MQLNRRAFRKRDILQDAFPSQSHSSGTLPCGADHESQQRMVNKVQEYLAFYQVSNRGHVGTDVGSQRYIQVSRSCQTVGSRYRAHSQGQRILLLQ